MGIDAGEQLSMNGKILIRRKAEGSLRQKSCNSDGDLVSFLCAVFRIVGRILLVISLQKRICLFKGNFTLNITDGSMHQIF